MGLGLWGIPLPAETDGLLGLGMGGEEGEGAGDLGVGGIFPGPGQVKAGLQGCGCTAGFPFFHPSQNRLRPNGVEALKTKAQGDGQINSLLKLSLPLETSKPVGWGPGLQERATGVTLRATGLASLCSGQLRVSNGREGFNYMSIS